MAFAEELSALVATLDLQIPTLLLGDPNGSVDPDRDFTSVRPRPVSPLLSRLLGYVALIPKASGGTRPQDQRPIAVLDVLYRL